MSDKDLPWCQIYDIDGTLVVDDRPKVCRMWRRLGLPVFQVGDPDVEF